MHAEVLVEVRWDAAEELTRQLAAEGIEFEAPDKMEGLDGVTIATIVVLVTPAVSSGVVKVIQALKGTKGRIRNGKRVVDFENLDDETLQVLISGSRDRT